MSINGFAGFPLLDGIPRGYSFVHFMRSQGASHTSITQSSSNGPAVQSASPVGPTQGGFDDAGGHTVTSENTTDLGNGTTRTDLNRTFDDGSSSTASYLRHADGTQNVLSERRSLPDAEGYQKVRVREETIDADGTRHVTINTFRVPAGLSMDWKSDAAQQYFLQATSKTVPPGMEWEDVPENRPVERAGDTPDPIQNDSASDNASNPPVIPLLT